jgi:hypothetical protein
MASVCLPHRMDSFSRQMVTLDFFHATWQVAIRLHAKYQLTYFQQWRPEN